MSLFSHIARGALLLAVVQAGVVQAQHLQKQAGTSHRASSAAPAVLVTPKLDAYQQALNSLRGGRVSEAHAQLRQRLLDAPEDLAARRLLASLLLDAGQSAEAAQVLAAGQAITPGAIDVAIALARLQAGQGAYANALRTLDLSAAYAEQNADYLAFMAVLAGQAGQAVRAIPLWQKALQLSPGRGPWLLALGGAQQATQDLAGARQSYEAAVESGQLDAAQQKQAHTALRQIRDPAL